MSETTPLQIGAEGVDVDAIVRELRERVAERRARGEYDEATVARAERFNLANLKDDAQFLERYLTCLRQAVQVDIDDFDIVERRARLAPLLKRLKRGIWCLLRFYTYRLWSQQNQINGMLLAATEIIATRDQERLDRIEARLSEIEARLDAAGKSS
ncbi:MAG: hypothetical protein GX174_00205 [Lentisphaerae bacterium]|jgi:hypothetical protein|nr:hypothetical protein [Lentisphaerota bacterium]